MLPVSKFDEDTLTAPDKEPAHFVSAAFHSQVCVSTEFQQNSFQGTKVTLEL